MNKPNGPSGLRQLIFEAALEMSLNLTTTEIAQLAHLVAEKAAVQRGTQVDTNLPPRQMDVLRALVAGETRQETAARLQLAENTVATHRRLLYKRLGAYTGGQAVAIASRHGLLPTGGAR
ncbi:LuxR C-terminal-related transcriptional regulator [Streptomyces sp. NPDC020298]|uniref:response regulator transcription factor n=1 Tax=unclassified Streptomyces TaxID=2593676 RepID=UPI003403FF97